MKFIQYLNESIITPNGIKLARDSANLERNMEKELYNMAIDFFIENEDKIKPILLILKHHSSVKPFLYRGVMSYDTNGKEFGLLPVRKDRKPLSTNVEISKIFDEYLYKKIKWHPRSEGLFCSFNRGITESYGNPCIIFPVGLLKYIYSPNISDSYNVTSAIKITDAIYEFDRDSYKDYSDLYNMVGSDNIDEKTINNMKKFWDQSYPIKTTGLHAQMVKRVEIILNCDEYIYFSVEMFELLKLLVYEGI